MEDGRACPHRPGDHQGTCSTGDARLPEMTLLFMAPVFEPSLVLARLRPEDLTLPQLPSLWALDPGMTEGVMRGGCPPPSPLLSQELRDRPGSPGAALASVGKRAFSSDIPMVLLFVLFSF